MQKLVWKLMKLSQAAKQSCDYEAVQKLSWKLVTLSQDA
jgi:hypothetical protein